MAPAYLPAQPHHTGRQSPRWVVATISLALFVCACSGPSTPVADPWPSGSARHLPRELIDIPALDDPQLVSEVDQLLAAIDREPTSRANLSVRVPVARRYYNALQDDGVLLPWIGLIMLNVMEGFVEAPESQYAAWVRNFDNFVRGMRFAHRHRHEIGTVEVVEPRDRSFEARAYTTITVVYRLGKIPMKTGARVRFGTHWYSDLSLPQLSRPLSPGYTTVKANRGDVALAGGFDGWQSVWSVLQSPAPRPHVTVARGELREGDTLTFVLGDRSQGSPGLLMQSFTTDAFTVRFEVDFDGSGTFIPVGLPRFQVKGTRPRHLRVVAPTTAIPGERFTVRASVEDAYFNRAVGCPGELILSLDGRDVGRARAIAGDEATFQFDGMVTPENHGEPLVFTARDASGTLFGRSNPVVPIAAGLPRVYWGDLHAHEGYTDGTGSAEWVARYARDVAFLDFVGLTGHDIMMSEYYQRDVQRVTRAFNEPGRFVTFKSYEWTQQAIQGGHHNVFYRDDAQRIIPVNEAPRIADLYRLQREVNDPAKVLIIPHTHEPGDWRFSDAQLERLVEIYSQHGSFEWFGRRYLAQGFHVGLIASSDDHTGHPGNNPTRISNRGGVVAVLAPARTREAIFDALVARRAYGSTLARIFLDVTVAGVPMGSETEVGRAPNESIEVKGRVAGTAPIARVVAVCNGEEVAEVDFLKSQQSAATSGARLVRVMLANLTEPPGSDVKPPLPRERWWGRITTAGAAISGATPLGLDGHGDTFRQVSLRRVDFSFTVRGDQDGVLLELADAEPAAAIKVEVFTRPYADLESWHVDDAMPLWGEELYYKTRLVTTFTVALGELGAGPQRHRFGERDTVLVESVAAGLTAYREFTFDLRDALNPAGESSVYVRAEQIDDETVWSSPVWVAVKQ
jgi:hypothetical protein